MISAAVSAQGAGEKQGQSAAKSTNVAMKIVMSAYPSAAKLTKVNAYWYRVTDKKGKTLGFAMNGTPYCKDVRGFSAATPMMVVTDKKGKIVKVSLMKNGETPAFVNKLKQRGFFDQWNGKTLAQAKAKSVDAYTGATFTGRAVTKNMKFLLDNGTTKFPKK
jgi:Na+-translocating ferredoxin:NAD+ oxidoreductase RnfG subunit